MKKVLTTGALSDPVVALMAIDTLLELVFWYKIHQLGLNCLSEMHFRSNIGKERLNDFKSLHFYVVISFCVITLYTLAGKF